MKRLFLGIILLSFTFTTPTFAKSSTLNSETLINKIIQKYSPLYKKYKGIHVVMKRAVKEYDPAKNKMTHTMNLTMKRKDYFYKAPEIMTLKYSRDGQKKPNKEFKHMEQQPFYPLFDKDSKKHYKITLIGKKTINGKKCYKLKVNPKKNNMSYFKGYAYISIKDLELIHLNGAPAKIGLPFKEFSIKVWFKEISELPVPKKIESLIRIYIPIILPDTRYKSVSNLSNIRLFK